MTAQCLSVTLRLHPCGPMSEYKNYANVERKHGGPLRFFDMLFIEVIYVDVHCWICDWCCHNDSGGDAGDVEHGMSDERHQ